MRRLRPAPFDPRTGRGATEDEAIAVWEQWRRWCAEKNDCRALSDFLATYGQWPPGWPPADPAVAHATCFGLSLNADRQRRRRAWELADALRIAGGNGTLPLAWADALADTPEEGRGICADINNDRVERAAKARAGARRRPW